MFSFLLLRTLRGGIRHTALILLSSQVAVFTPHIHLWLFLSWTTKFIKLLKSGFKGGKKVAIELNRLGVPRNNHHGSRRKNSWTLIGIHNQSLGANISWILLMAIVISGRLTGLFCSFEVKCCVVFSTNLSGWTFYFWCCLTKNIVQAYLSLLEIFCLCLLSVGNTDVCHHTHVTDWILTLNSAYAMSLGLFITTI